jgi:hypothetical protein
MLTPPSLVMDLVSERKPGIFYKTREAKDITLSLKYNRAGIYTPALLIVGEKITVFGRAPLSRFYSLHGKKVNHHF